MDPAPQAPTPPSAAEPPPTAAAPPPQPPPPSPQPPPSEAPSSSEIPPPPPATASAASASTSGPSPPNPTQNPPTPTQPQTHPSQPSQQQRPPLPRIPRPPSPYSHFMQPPSMSSSSHPSPLPPSSSAMPRGGLAIGVPAHQHPRPPQPPAGLSSFGPSAAFSQGYSPLSRNSGGSDQSASNSQVTTPPTGIRNIGMFGSLSSGSQIRPGGLPGQAQHGPGQSSLRTASPSTNQSSQTKFHGHGLSRTPSIASPSSLSPVPQSNQSQQLTSAQGKQIHASSLPSSYRPQMKSQSLPQRPHQLQLHNHSLMASSHQQQPPSYQQQQHQQQQKHQQLQQLQQQFQQQQAPLPHQSQENHGQQYVPLRSQQAQQQQAARAHGSTAQKSNISTLVQSGIVQSAPGITADDAESGNQILSKRSIRELVTQIDPSEKLDPEVEDVLVEIADDFIGSITTFACSLAKHRNSKILEAKDILLHVERSWNITLPGYGGDEIKCYKKQIIQATNDIHKERISAIKKSMVGTSDAGSAKNPTLAQAAGNTKPHSAKAPATTGQADRGS